MFRCFGQGVGEAQDGSSPSRTTTRRNQPAAVPTAERQPTARTVSVSSAGKRNRHEPEAHRPKLAYRKPALREVAQPGNASTYRFRRNRYIHYLVQTPSRGSLYAYSQYRRGNIRGLFAGPYEHAEATDVDRSRRKALYPCDDGDREQCQAARGAPLASAARHRTNPWRCEP